MRRIGGAERPSTSELVCCDPPLVWTVRGIDGPIRARVDLSVEALPKSLSRLSIAVDFAEQGDRVHVADIDEAAVTELVESHPNITGSVEDISVPETVDAWFADVERELGRLNVLVNNAGISGPTAPADEPCAGRFANRGGLRE